MSNDAETTGTAESITAAWARGDRMKAVDVLREARDVARLDIAPYGLKRRLLRTGFLDCTPLLPAEGPLGRIPYPANMLWTLTPKGEAALAAHEARS